MAKVDVELVRHPLWESSQPPEMEPDIELPSFVEQPTEGRADD
jgi:hypothetical protein